MDYAAKGTQVNLEGVEKVEGRDTYRLKLTVKDGQVRRLWVDPQTFLEAKIEGVPDAWMASCGTSRFIFATPRT